MSARNAEILVCTLGTRGDILPFLALCTPFISKGHRVTVLTNRNWKDLVENSGAEFHEIAGQDLPQSGRDDKAFYRSSTFPSFSRSFSFIRQRAATNPHCAVIYRFNMLGAECAARKFQLPSIKVALQPSVVKSVERPPWPLTRLVHGPLAGLAKKVIVPAVYKIGEIAAEYREYTNSFLNEVGFEKLAFGSRLETEDLFLILCPDWFAMPQKDWPDRSRLTGFLFLDGDQQDDELEAFISVNGPPLVFTPGTGVSDAGGFFERAASLCRALSLPGVFLSPALRHSGTGWPERILARDHAELHWLLPRSRMLVHHGGIGSTAQAIRAGIPQLVLPDRFDQPDNALRVAILGLGGTVFSRDPDLSELTDMVRNILASATVERQVQTGAALVRAHPARDLAHQMICTVMDRYFRAGATSPTAQAPRRVPEELLS